MRARKVKKLDPDASLGEGAARIVRVRLDELYSFTPAVLDPRQVTALHDMRIAAKRLRYVLEVTEPCFGPAARTGLSAARRLQEVLGEIHDCDVMLPRVEAHLGRLADEDVAAARAGADGASDLPAAAVGDAPNRRRYLGLQSLATYLRARRVVLYQHFIEHWSELEQDGFRQRLEADLVPR
jgi:hypothetical protein